MKEQKCDFAVHATVLSDVCMCASLCVSQELTLASMVHRLKFTVSSSLCRVQDKISDVLYCASKLWLAGQP